MTIYRMPEGYDQGLMDGVCEWLRANDITPGDVPLHSEVTVTGHIAYYEQIRGNGITWISRTKPLISPMPDALAVRWRVPTTLCPHCGTDINAAPASGGDR